MGASKMNVRIIVWGFLLSQFAFPQTTYSQTWHGLYHTADSILQSGYGAAMPRGFEMAHEALAIAEKEFGATDSNVAKILALCAQLLVTPSVGRLTEAQTCAERSLEINTKVFGPDHPKIAEALNTLACTGSYKRNPQEAMILLERARLIYEQAGVTRSNEYASLLHDIAFNAQRTGDFTYAGSMFKRALDLFRQILPTEDPGLAYTLTMFAVNYWKLGLFHEAEPLLREALYVWQKKYGEESMQSAICMGNLWQHYVLLGRIAESKLLSKKCAVIFQRELPPDDPYFANCVIGFGEDLMSCGNYDEAVDSLMRAVRIFEGMKEMSGRISWAIRLIGECRFAQHNYTLAESTFRRAIALADSLSPGTSNQGSDSYLALARTIAREKKFESADSLFTNIVRIRQECFGPDNLDVANALEAYGECARLKGDAPKALELSRRAIDMRARNFVLNARMMSEQDARSYARFLRRSVDMYLSSYFDGNNIDSSAISNAARIILSTKGQSTEQAILRQQKLVTTSDSVSLALARKYRYVRFQLSKYYVGGLKENSAEGLRRKVDSLETLSNDLESALAQRGEGTPITDRNVKVDPVDIALSLPPRSSLVEYMKYNYVRLNPDTLLPRYLALVISAEGKTNIVNLGDAVKIDRTIEEYRAHFKALAETGRSAGVRDETAYRTIARNLLDLVWQQCEIPYKEKGLIFVAPDAGLNLVSFAGLCNTDGKFLIEQHAIHYVSAGRDLLRPSLTTGTNSGCVAFGDPDFNATVVERLASRVQIAGHAIPPDPNQSGMCVQIVRRSAI